MAPSRERSASSGYSYSDDGADVARRAAAAAAAAAALAGPASKKKDAKAKEREKKSDEKPKVKQSEDDKLRERERRKDEDKAKEREKPKAKDTERPKEKRSENGTSSEKTKSKDTKKSRESDAAPANMSDSRRSKAQEKEKAGEKDKGMRELVQDNVVRDKDTSRIGKVVKENKQRSERDRSRSRGEAKKERNGVEDRKKAAPDREGVTDEATSKKRKVEEKQEPPEPESAPVPIAPPSPPPREPSPPPGPSAADIEEEAKKAKQRELEEKVQKTLQEAREKRMKEEQAKKKESQEEAARAKKDKERESFLDGGADHMLGDDGVPEMLVPQERGKAPCDLPMWCVVPNEDDIVKTVDIYRHMVSCKADAPPRVRRLLLGRRSWVLIGRRDKQLAPGGTDPDIGLGCARASRMHAVLFRNWTGQVFLMDLGSAHGSYLGSKKLKPHAPTEWKADVMAYFADKSVEAFKLQDLAGALPAVSAAAAAPLPSAAAAAPLSVEQLQRLLLVAEQEEEGRTPAAPVSVAPTPIPEPAAPALNPFRSSFDEPTVSAEAAGPLYPDAWAVPADGITEFYGKK